MLGRCHALRCIRGHQGLITAGTHGTIEAEISNLGRHLVAVHWDNGLHMYVFPEEIEIHQQESECDDELEPTVREEGEPIFASRGGLRTIPRSQESR
jgi:hypothetical protein